VRTQDPSQVLELHEHLDRVARFDASDIEDLRRLAVQLAGKEVLPLIGAGGSVDCGMRLARDLAADLLQDYLNDPAYAPHAPHLNPNLGDVAQEIYAATGSQRAVVDALGLHEPALWPRAEAIPEHWCGYRVLARLTREGLFEEAVTLNYDCSYEAGLRCEGFLLEPDARPGLAFSDHATVMADARTGSSVDAKGPLVLRKIHGCTAHYRRERLRDPAGTPEEDIVVRREQLEEWRERNWARNHLQWAAREHVFLTIGFSAQDPIIVNKLTDVLAEVFTVRDATGDPRVVVIDHTPTTPELGALVESGLGGVPADAEKVAFVETSRATTTAALLVLLTELLTHRFGGTLAAAGSPLPAELDERLALLAFAAPAMLRWSYLLRKREDGHLLQRTNLHSMAERGYVPLTDSGETTIRVLGRRAALRAALGLAPGEQTAEVLAHHGFVVNPMHGVAYLPTGLDDDVLEAACRPGGRLHDVRLALSSPSLECVMVGEGRRGFTLSKGKEVTVP
jgi:SIR2-like domain